MTEPKKPCERSDEIALGPSVDGDSRIAIRHRADHTLSIGVVRPVREGDTLDNAFEIEPKDQEREVYRVKQVTSGHGPAKVNSRAFHDGWDRIFGGKQTVGQA